MQQFFFNFAMRVKNRFETFKKFLIRFTSIINFLRFIDDDKITHLYKNLFDQLTKKIYHLNATTKYSKYVKNVRQIINQIKIRQNIKHNMFFNTITRSRFIRIVEIRKNSNFKKIGERFKAKIQILIKNMLARLSTHIKRKFKKKVDASNATKKVIYSQLETTTHHVKKKFITRDKIETLFSKMNIKYNEVDFVYFDESKIDVKNINDDAQ